MPRHDRSAGEALSLKVGDQQLAARHWAGEGEGVGIGVVFVHGWGSGQAHYRELAATLCEAGAACLSFDMRGHGKSDGERARVTRQDNLDDVLCAFDAMAGLHGVDPSRITLVGTSYGGYLAAIATALRPVHALALRAPAQYPDAQWSTPKAELNREWLNAYRRAPLPPEGNRALSACAQFWGSALLVESAHDQVIPQPTTASYASAFMHARSFAYYRLPNADHALMAEADRRAYVDLLLDWLAAAM